VKINLNINIWSALKFAKYLLIPILLLLYINYSDVLIGTAFTVLSGQGQGGEGGGLEQIGVGFAATVSVTRPYLFGMVRLPVYAGDVGDISGFHTTFFAILGVITIAFVIWDLRFLLKGKTSYTYGSKYQWRR
jgi:hypothetical protein